MITVTSQSLTFVPLYIDDAWKESVFVRQFPDLPDERKARSM